eukprot:scaffold22_cov107-Isochrysis_galbana.AAC.6
MYETNFGSTHVKTPHAVHRLNVALRRARPCRPVGGKRRQLWRPPLRRSPPVHTSAPPARRCHYADPFF